MKTAARPKKGETWETKRDRVYVTIDRVTHNGIVTYTVRWSLTEYTCSLEAFHRNYRFVCTSKSTDPKALFGRPSD